MRDYNEYAAWAKLKHNREYSVGKVTFKPNVYYRVRYDIGYSWDYMYYYPIVYCGTTEVCFGDALFKQLFITKRRTY